ncbi:MULTISPECIES: endonuclease III [Thermodesulfobacterium]|jgi:endonuclease-3|uniref:Endonuclease III n=2 Tax=Thermodesulfobacterium commune TaxID=1741 RepID=A0A075WT03_9BACT|nr:MULTISPECIES: endonuclease III [Thermodesulfobacterium]KUJ97945.1 MAG: Endonuclease III [Thermodesulfobacterium sp. 37_54]KUK19684.1 MAG: Endonuclease III [Thermodesulfobacterium commune]AIH04120.1 endonuclease III [Thermodesulfobacterium commune DSM 2178]KUK38228.1 MAG: Endonuclease III [Thermodesulfobacterium commune]MBZ4682278.1 endonuclease [Thermodesulfobacterium sp.]
MDVKQKVKLVIERLKNLYPDAKIALKFENPLQLLISTILSAQCTDERVNEVTAKLFQKYRTAEDFAKASLEELAEDIKSTGFYQQKAKYIKEACQILVEKYNGEVPKTMEALLELPGVARKTANIVLANAYGIVEGIPVDTHVRRLSQRIGLVKANQPEKIEKELMEIVPKEEWFIFPYLLQAHGRKVCLARKPKCEECVIKDLCDAYTSKN